MKGGQDRAGANKSAVEESEVFAPAFGRDGLLTCVTIEARSGALLMVAHMNAEALRLTLETGVAHYWSRSRSRLWRKGDTSGQVQKVLEARVDCDQDALALYVDVGGDGGACHTGRRTCFYRRIDMVEGAPRLSFVEGAPPDAGGAAALKKRGA